MDIAKIYQLLDRVQNRKINIDEALQILRNLPFDDLDGYARLDMHRTLRQGLPEVIFCMGKTPDQIVGIMNRLWQHHDQVMGTRADQETADHVLRQIPDANYDPVSRLLTLSRSTKTFHHKTTPYAVVVTGGTSD